MDEETSDALRQITATMTALSSVVEFLLADRLGALDPDERRQIAASLKQGLDDTSHLGRQLPDEMAEILADVHVLAQRELGELIDSVMRTVDELDD